MNILMLSVGTRNKIVQYFKRTLNGNGKVVVTDMIEIAPAIYEADEYYIVPRITDPNYINIILDICKKEDISGVLSLIDPELSLLAENKSKFDELGVTIIGSDYDVCEMSLDKMRMYQFCIEHGFNAAKSWNDKDKFYNDFNSGLVTFPVFVKPQLGSASIAISKVYDAATLDLIWNNSKGDLMIQEFLDGQEIGADVYIDMISNEVVSIFTKKKLLMRAGETDKAVSFIDNKLNDLIIEFVNKAGYKGQIDIDIFDVNGEYYISEVNPRFGGGYPHAYECGVDHMKLIENNLNGITNVSHIGQYEEDVYMMKYNEVAIVKK